MSGHISRIGVIGCGKISGVYFDAAKMFGIIEVVACADMVPARAQERKEEFGIPRACSVDEILADPDIKIILNLTIPAAHAEVAMAALEVIWYHIQAGEGCSQTFATQARPRMR